ncbi:MAG: flagellar hook-associated protein FlgL [Acidobacteria bacterium]|nr:flagellar hook-associated protein FlgL [Acidobacteriota bacterium]
MRVTQSELCRTFLSDLGTLNENLTALNRQISSGKRLNQLKDDPAGSSDLISFSKLESQIDQYRFNAGAGSFYLNVADSALNEVNNLITSIYASGSQSSSDIVSEEARAALAAEVRSLRDQIVSLANSQVRGRYIFAGSLVVDMPFAIEGDVIEYNGDNSINRIRVDEGTEVQMNYSGGEVFDPIFNAVRSLLTAMDGNDTSGINTALSQFASVLKGLSQIRGQIGANMATLQNVESRLDSRETILKEQRSRIEDTDMVQAAVELKQTQTALQTAMSAGGSILTQSNLFDILG